MGEYWRKANGPRKALALTGWNPLDTCRRWDSSRDGRVVWKKSAERLDQTEIKEQMFIYFFYVDNLLTTWHWAYS